MNKNQKLSEILYEAREKQGLTQVQFAEKADMYPNTYARIERGEQKPKLETLALLSKASGIKLPVLTQAWIIEYGSR